MEHAPKSPSLAITVFGTAGFMLAALGGFISTILLLGLLFTGGSDQGIGSLGLGSAMFPQFVLMSAIGFLLFRLARLIESGYGQSSAWTVVLLFGTVGAFGALNTTGILGGLYAALLAGSALSAGSLHECRDWFRYAARTERPARRRLVIRFVDEPEVRQSRGKLAVKRAAKPARKPGTRRAPTTKRG